MGIVDHKSKVIRYFHHFDPALDLCHFQSLLNIADLDSEVSADRYRSQRIVDRELAGYIKFDRERHGADDIECHAEISRLRNMLNIDSPDIRIRIIDSVGLHTAGVSFKDLLCILVIGVNDTVSALPE